MSLLGDKLKSHEAGSQPNVREDSQDCHGHLVGRRHRVLLQKHVAEDGLCPFQLQPFRQMLDEVA